MRSITYYLLVLIVLPVTLTSQTLEPGTSYFAPNEYTEYIHGNLPLIISAPHGGEKKPVTIPDRNCSGCVYVNDSYTQELAREITQKINEITGCYPFVIINRLHRSKLDANRNQTEGADGNEEAEIAWNAYHSYIDTAQNYVNDNFSKGLFIDLHGHGHKIQRLELGYLLSRSDLQMSNSQLDNPSLVQKSSIRNLVSDNLLELNLPALIRGNYALGTLMEDKGYPGVPSKQDHNPVGNEPYFTGGYNTQQYGSRGGGPIDAIQIECNQEIRFDPTERKQFADSLATALLQYLEHHYFETLSPDFCRLSSINDHPALKYFFLPNPVETHLYLKSEKYPCEVIIYNTLGERVKFQQVNSLNTYIDVSELLPGLHFMVLIREGKSLGTEKVIKF